MNKTLIIMFLWGFACIGNSNALARMGETIAQCDRRYGPPVSTNQSLGVLPGVPTRTYKYHGWRITAAFVQGRAAVLSYSKSSIARIQDDELAAILKSETYGGTWKRKRQYSWNPTKNLQNLLTHPKVWSKTNGTIAYFSNPMYDNLIVEAPIAQKYREAKDKAAEERRKASIPAF